METEQAGMIQKPKQQFMFHLGEMKLSDYGRGVMCMRTFFINPNRTAQI